MYMLAAAFSVGAVELSKNQVSGLSYKTWLSPKVAKQLHMPSTQQQQF
jgi:hypothetical protein